ncbi:receptor-like protein 43 [Manihot esculenta]|uniref:receptor-like protein 43 n=1 Tax=Manihot esculenta TaxID=3983 RepID=UPI000B5D88FD|nr:receptor-like protein 43 [Manihot esculenta]
MESPPLFVRFLSFLMLTTLCHAIAFTQSFNSSIQRCHDDESLALLQFKNSFNISSSCSYSKLESWKLNQGVRSGECCSWDGVECDEKTNHVVSVDLSESCIYGSINSNSTLFRLVHFQRLNLGSNDFIHSQIPSEIGQLSRLTHLDSCFSGFSGEIPAGISNLSSLVSLDLSRNLDFISYDGLLKLRQTSFRGLVQNMTNFKELDLECMDISSTVLANLSSLESLHLCCCELHGEFPASIFWLPNLKIINLCENINLTGFLPDFHPRSHLERLRLFSISFYGKVPPSIGNLTNLENQLTGPIPSQINNLTSLSSLCLSSNKLQGSIPINFTRLNQLEFLDLHSNTLAGSLDLSSFFQLNHDLSVLDLRRNNFHGIIPAACRDDCKLRMISISYNQLQGQVPKSLANCSSLQSKTQNQRLPKSSNHRLIRQCFVGKLPSVYLDMWEAMKTIQANHMTYMGENMRPNFTDVDTYYGEYDYSMTMFNKGVKLEYDKIQDIFLAIDFSNNRFEGKIPEIIGNHKGLNLLNLSNNLLKGHIPPSLASLSLLEGLDLSKNKLSGKIPPELAQLTFLAFFNVSYKELEGPIPQGKQFDTFQSNQYEGNLGLYGAPLTKKCEDFGDSPPFFPTSDDESISLECKPSDLRRCTYYQTRSVSTNSQLL